MIYIALVAVALAVIGGGWAIALKLGKTTMEKTDAETIAKQAQAADKIAAQPFVDDPLGDMGLPEKAPDK